MLCWAPNMRRPEDERVAVVAVEMDVVDDAMVVLVRVLVEPNVLQLDSVAEDEDGEPKSQWA